MIILKQNIFKIKNVFILTSKNLEHLDKKQI